MEIGFPLSADLSAGFIVPGFRGGLNKIESSAITEREASYESSLSPSALHRN